MTRQIGTSPCAVFRPQTEVGGSRKKCLWTVARLIVASSETLPHLENPVLDEREREAAHDTGHKVFWTKRNPSIVNEKTGETVKLRKSKGMFILDMRFWVPKSVKIQVKSKMWS